MSKSNNTRGNPYHDDETGEFTSAGVSAVKRQKVGDKIASAKTERTNQAIRKFGGIDGFIRNASSKSLRYYIDDNLSVPLVEKYSRKISENLFVNYVTVNTDDELDKLGVDLIGYDDPEGDIVNDDFIDVKTAYGDNANISIFSAEMDMNKNFRLRSGWVIDPKQKHTTAFLFNFVKENRSLTNQEKVKLIHDLGWEEYEQRYISNHDLYLLDSADIQTIIDTEIGQKQISKLYDDYAQCFDSNGKLINPELFNNIISRFGEPFPLKNSPGYYAGKITDWETGFSVTLKYNTKKPYAGITCSVQFSNKMLSNLTKSLTKI